MFKVYIINTHQIKLTNDYYQFVPSKKLKKVQNSTNETYIKEQLIGQKLLNYILVADYHLDLSKIEYIYNDYGKPYLKNLNLFFSISHSNGVVVVGVSEKEVGIDLELVRPVPFVLVKKVLSMDELSKYQSLDEKEKLEYFFSIWTKKEALVKKNGTSVIFNANKIASDKKIYTTSIRLDNQQYLLSSTIANLEIIIKENI